MQTGGMSGGGLMRVFRVLPVGSGADVEDLGLQAHGFARLRPGQGPAGLVPLREAAALAFAQDSQLRDFAPGGLWTRFVTPVNMKCMPAFPFVIYQDDMLVCTRKDLTQD